MRPTLIVPAMALAAVLAGCTSVPLVSKPAEPKPVASSPATGIGTATPTPTVSFSKPGRGAYYQDDGPGDNAPPNLTQIPDAIPRVETYSRSANRPYNVFGLDFVPDTSDKPFKQQGMGSWYGRKFHGQKTAIGEIYDMYAMTAAHPTLPLPSYAKVTNMATGQSVIVRVNDRGPFLRSRIMDLSYAAALKLGYVDQGSAMIEVERLLPNDIMAGKFRPSPWATQIAAATTSANSKVPVPATAVAVDSPAPGNNVSLDADRLPAPNLDEARLTALIAAASSETSPGKSTPPITPMSTPIASNAKGFFLQLASFRARNLADEFKQKVALEIDSSLTSRLVINAASISGTEWFRVQLGPYTDHTQANTAAQSLRSMVNSSYRPIIVLQP